ncbi:beta-N-acetylhexosaminidase [uncultured Victivallis sp.]|uniref:beta-N-acetylhexosaminidase n=1 Tax=uncultured Victivallis sp. TaxID=354118 RepID=UPI0025D06805|nr:beta-N-acetylhexosaminidase [uncultured Victivallis sp.]
MAQISRLVWRSADVPEELHELLETLEEEYPVSSYGRGLKLKAKRVEGAGTISRVKRSPGTVLVEYNSIAAAARGIGSALGKIECDESTPFKTLGIMLDVSRNMVMRIDHLKMWLRRLALSGYNMVMLYTEDVYELPDEPFFGYMRGAYTLDEIRELDVYASRLGIELVGCIQTLGHLEQILKWDGAYNKVKDTASVLMVDEPETYKLIEKMIRFWSEALTSRRIHIGMDETHDLGRGRFLDIHGYESGFELFNRHLGKVNAICKEAGLSPMIWSDMYFRLSNPNQDYYDLEHAVPEAVQKKIPQNVQLVYWDYYHQDAAMYEKMIQRHRDIGFDPVMGSGIWTWTRLWYDHKKTMQTAVPCIQACRKQKVSELFFTMWGDDGAYCNYDSSLAGIIFCADLAFGVPANDPHKETSRRFAAICQSSYEAHLVASDIEAWDDFGVDPALMIWDDPLLGILFDDCKRRNPEFDLKLSDRYDEMLRKLLPYQEECFAGDFEHIINALQLLLLKLELRGALEAAYDRDDRIALRQIAVSLIPAVIAAVWEFDASFRRQWLKCAKPFGLEVIQARNAVQAARLEETALRIREYLDGTVASIEELDARISPSEKTVNFLLRCNRVVTGSMGL